MKRYLSGLLGVAFALLILGWIANLDQQSAKDVLDSFINWDAMNDW
ncbi:hypothetical protein [Paraliobacillus salinarum]|nr:hypothetical protein [Paraliobacillus salinarum]